MVKKERLQLCQQSSKVQKPKIITEIKNARALNELALV